MHPRDLGGYDTLVMTAGIGGFVWRFEGPDRPVEIAVEPRIEANDFEAVSRMAVAGLGVVIGQGHYGLALAGALVMVIVLVAFDSIFGWIDPVIYRRVIVTGRDQDLVDVSASVRKALEQRRIKIQDLTASCDRDGEALAFQLVFHVRCRRRLGATAVLAELNPLPGVHRVEWSQLTD